MKVYKITLYVSLMVFVILTILSVVLNFWNDNEWIAFIVNWCVGIACSIVVVIITTFIQFKVEQKKAIDELATTVRSMLFRNQLKGAIFVTSPYSDFSHLSEQQISVFEKSWLDGINEDIKKIQQQFGNIEFFFAKKKCLAIIKGLNPLIMALINGNKISDKYFESQEKIYNLAKAISSLDFKGYSRDEIESYLVMYEQNNSFQPNYTEGEKYDNRN